MESSSVELELYKKYRPTKFGEVYGQDAALKSLTELGKRGGIPHAIMFAGPSGCLRGDVPIPDPSDGTSLTIAERYEIGKPFHVLSYNKANGAKVITPALPPVRYPEAEMFCVRTTNSTFHGTGEHRVLLHDGTYMTLKALIALDCLPVVMESSYGNHAMITSITPAGTDVYYDFHVPIYNNYWAVGMFHHNCGKTTLARILRKRLKCSDTDYLELDAAQFRGIDTVREIRTKMHLAPLGGDCRVYLLDEAHQLTGAAADALLKMLEDTPSHVYFFLCTTDPQKLKATIRTRCTQITVKPLGRVDSLKLIDEVAAKEKIPVTDEVKDKIIEMADGSARKTLVLLNSVIGLSDEESQLEVLNVRDTEAEAISLCRVLFNTKATFRDAVKVLKGLQEEPEQIRWMVLGFATSALIRGGSVTPRAYEVISAFRDNFFDSKRAGLVAACYEVLEK